MLRVGNRLRKWEDARPENLEKRGVTYNAHKVRADRADHPRFDGDSCALCVKFYRVMAEEACAKCPIFQSTGESCQRSWDASYKTPGDMINLLRRVQEEQEVKP